MVLHIRNNLGTVSNHVIKRFFDVMATVLGGILLIPFLLLIACWVYYDSPGSVIYKQRRVGKMGKNSIAINSGACISMHRECCLKFLHPIQK